MNSNEVKKKEKGEGEEGEEGSWTRRNVEKEKSTISLRPNCPAYFPASPLVQEGSTTIMAVPPKGSLLGNEATKLRSPRYLFLALPAQTTPTFFPHLSFLRFRLERPLSFPRLQVTVFRGTKSANYFLKPCILP